ncbi:hypothetical protein MITS9509_01804 [Synechococcus sp. MIT S9509]|nr:hypothetical protein MITS9509_01804 [Synechococcus sp. MIT S9509]
MEFRIAFMSITCSAFLLDISLCQFSQQNFWFLSIIALRNMPTAVYLALLFLLVKLASSMLFSCDYAPTPMRYLRIN